MRDSLPSRPNFHCAAAMSITPARSSSPACGSTPATRSCCVCSPTWISIKSPVSRCRSRAALALRNTACGSNASALLDIDPASAASDDCNCCERNASTPSSVSAPRRSASLRFHFHHRTRDCHAGNAATRGYRFSSRPCAALDRQVGEPVQAARRQRHFIGSRTVDEIDRETERDAERDRNDEQRVASRRAPHRPGECGIDERPRLHDQTARALVQVPAASGDRRDRAVAAATSECVTRMPAALSRLSCAAQQFEHFRRRIRIEIARRFVREHEARPMRQRTRDRDALHFTARQLRSADRAARSSMPTAASISATRASIARGRRCR